MSLKEDFLSLLEERRNLTKSTLELVATETTQPPIVLEAYAVFSKYYSVGPTTKEKEYLMSLTEELEEIVTEILRKLYGIKYYSFKFCSATQANHLLSLFFDGIGLAHPLEYAGHYSHYFRPTEELIFYPEEFRYGEENVEKYEELGASRVFVGNSAMLFLPKVPRLRNVIFDASQVMGLLDREKLENVKFDVIVASAHKTFPGIQSAFVGFKEGKLFESFEEFLFPRYIEGIKAGKIAAIGAAGIWLLEYGKRYRRRANECAKYIGEGLLDKGYEVLFRERGFTDTHTILVKGLDDKQLSKIGVKASMVRWGDEEVLRIGTQDIAMKELIGIVEDGCEEIEEKLLAYL